MSKVIQVRNVPDDVHRTLKARAAKEGRSLSELVREQLIAHAKQPTLTDFFERLDALPPLDPGESAAEAIRAGRAER